MKEYINMCSQDIKLQVQIKDPVTKESLSFTVKNIVLKDLYARLLFTSRLLENNQDKDIRIVHYNTKNKELILGEENKN